MVNIAVQVEKRNRENSRRELESFPNTKEHHKNYTNPAINTINQLSTYCFCTKSSDGASK